MARMPSTRSQSILRRHHLVLVVVVLTEAILFAGFHYERYFNILLPRGDRQISQGEGLCINCDGLGYYAWLRSLLLDGDWNFENEFDEFNPLKNGVPGPREQTAVGRRANPWSIGPACLWALAVVPGHAVMKWVGPVCRWPADGYSLPYQLVTGGVTWLGSLLGVFWLYRIASRFARPERAALAAAFLTLATTIVFYSAVEVTMAHGLGTAVTAGLVSYWLKTYSSPRPRRWVLLGTLVGLAALMRYQFVTLMLLPAAEAFLNGIRTWRRVGRLPPSVPLNLIWSALAAALVIFPQAYAWHVVYGYWLGTPIQVSRNWTHPSFWQILFSQDRSLFYWTPLVLLVCLGCLAVLAGRFRTTDLAGRDREPFLILTTAFAVQVYVLASLWGGEVFLGVSFGFRHLTESLVLLVPGLALLLERASPRRFIAYTAVGCILVGWNLNLVCQYRHGWVAPNGPTAFSKMRDNSWRMVRRRRLLLLEQVLPAPVLLAAVLWLRRRQVRPDDYRLFAWQTGRPISPESDGRGLPFSPIIPYNGVGSSDDKHTRNAVEG